MSVDRYLREFPDYDGDLPDLFDLGFTDQSWHNDTCPRLEGPEGLSVWCDYVDHAKREFESFYRFSVVRGEYGEENVNTLLETSDEAELRAFVESILPVTIHVPLEFAERCRDRRTTPAKVLKGFIADLCGLEGEDYRNHGSNERRAAREWFNLIPWHIYKK